MTKLQTVSQALRMVEALPLLIHTFQICRTVVFQFSSVAQLCPILWDPMDCSTPGGIPSLSPTLGACSNSCPSSPTISSSVVLFSSCLQSFPASGSFQMRQFFTSDGQRIGVSASASVLLMNIQNWFPLGWTGWISLQSKGLSRVFSNTAVQFIWLLWAYFTHSLKTFYWPSTEIALS